MDIFFDFLASRWDLLATFVAVLSLILTLIPTYFQINQRRKQSNARKQKDRFTITITDNKMIGKNKISVSANENDIKEMKSITGNNINIDNSIGTVINISEQLDLLKPEANLENIVLSGADLESMNLRRSNLRSANFKYSNLSSTDLSGANLELANFENAFLSNALLASSNLRGANFANAYLHGVKLDKAIYDENTIWPKDFEPESAGAIKESKATIEKK